MDPAHARRKAQLKRAAVIIGSFGPVFALGTLAATDKPARLTLDLLGWRGLGLTTFQASETRFLSALSGGFLLGWGVMIWCLSVWVYDAAPEGVRRSVLAGVLAWFVLDSAGSIASGFPTNAGFNVLVLVATIGPLWRPVRPE